MRGTTWQIICILIASFSIPHCDIINPEEERPSYLHIESIDLKTDYPTEGTDNHKITDAWVFVDNDLVGIYELPSTLPVLKKGRQDIRVRAGIQQNGISDTRVIYPFYQSYDTTVMMEKVKVDTLTPTVTYFDKQALSYTWMEDFESGNSFDEASFSATVKRTATNNDPSYLKNWTGKVTLNTSNPDFFAESNFQFANPDNNREVYLELNYKCSTPFSVGIIGDQNGQLVSNFKVTVNKKPVWNKIYIDFTNEIKSYTGDFKVIFKSTKPDSVSSAEIYFDNIKLIHFN